MNTIKQKLNILSFAHIGIYFSAFLNIFLFLGMVIGRNYFFHSFYMGIGLVMNIAALVTIIMTRIPFKFDEMRDEGKFLIISAGFELLLLFGLPLHQLQTINLILMQVLVVLIVQSFAAVFFWRASKNELWPLLIFFVIAGSPFAEILAQKFSSFKSRIPEAVYFLKAITQEKLTRPSGLLPRSKKTILKENG